MYQERKECEVFVRDLNKLCFVFVTLVTCALFFVFVTIVTWAELFKAGLN